MKEKIGKIRWTIVVMLLFSYAFMYMARTAVSLTGPLMMQDNGWSATQFGLVSTAFFIGYALTMFPAGWLADKFGATKVISVGILTWAVFTFFSPFASSIGFFIFIRILVGIGQGVTLPSASSVMAKWVPKKEAATAQGICQIGTPLGTTLSMFIGVQIIAAFGWKYVFYIFAFLGPIWVAVWLKNGKDRPDLHKGLTKEEFNYITADQKTASGSTTALPPLPTPLVVKNKNVWAATIAYFCFTYVFYLLLTWLPTYLALGRGFTLVKSGYFTAIPYMVAWFTYPLGGILADKAAEKFGQGGRKLMPVIGMLFGGVCLFFGANVPSAGLAIALISASMGFLTLTQGGFFSLPTIFAPRNVGTLVGLYGFIGTMGGISAPVVTGMIVDSAGYNYALYLGAAMALISSLVLIFFCRVKPVQEIV